MLNITLWSVFQGTLIGPVKQAGLPSPFDRRRDASRGVKPLANRGEGTLDSNPALTLIACGF